MLKPLLLVAAGGTTLLATSDLYFEPSEGSELTRSFTLEMEGGLEDAEVTVMGQVQSLEDMVEGDMETEGETTVTWEVIDSIESVERGRALVFDRVFGEFLVDGDVPEDDEDEPEMPESVRFEWDAEAEAYDVTVTEEGASDEAEATAQALLAEMDYQFLLPEGDVEDEGTWTVEVDSQRLTEMLFPGLDMLALAELMAELDDEVDSDQLDRFLEAWSDFDPVEVTLTYAGTTTDDEVECDVINLEFELDDTLDVGDMVMEEMDEEDAEGMSDLVLSVAYEVEGTGRMLWHKGEHRLHAMQADMEISVELEGSATIGDENFQLPIDGFATAAATVSASQRVE
ncbi:MAG: hypothetical protein AAFZ65_12885 [Planctomycetota bacterium]